MKANWKTTLFGVMASLPMILGQLGMSIGHIGNVTVDQAVGAIGLLGLGWYAKDKEPKLPNP